MSLNFNLKKLLISESSSPTSIRLSSSWVKFDQLPAGAIPQFFITDFEHGQFLVNGNASNEFTWEQLRAGQISFLHDGSSHAPRFTLTAKLGEEWASVTTSAANLSFKATNDKAIISQKAFTLEEGGQISLKSMFTLYDEEDSAAGILGGAVYKAKVKGGKIYVDGQWLEGKSLKTFTH